jgi:hypothetical protein
VEDKLDAGKSIGGSIVSGAEGERLDAVGVTA